MKMVKGIYKRWLWGVLGLTFAALIICGGVVAAVDPFFHYHGPIEGLSYPIDSERYQNDGISRHFAYDAVLTGTSMTENFKASQFDRLFGVTSIKIPFGGATYKEVDQTVRRAIAYNPEIRVVLRSLDGNFLLADKDDWNETAPNPDYLYDENILNDVNYVWNKEVLFGNVKSVLGLTKAGGHTTTFDEYMNWAPEKEWGKEAVLRTYGRVKERPKELPFTEEDRVMVTENLEQNVLASARANPQITFYYFIPPYSISYWDSELLSKGELRRYAEALRLEAELLLECENVRLFGFDDQFDITCDLGNYMDVIHYSEAVGDQLIQWMAEGEHRLTKENAGEYFERVEEFYRNYDYDRLYEPEEE
ncbi:hypothetical protein [Lacrimispora sp. 210928-DFI.3.58]|uniref:hypothetical protein n=1 Tax=Lacrimispora sp. 210928-DFI.3.58 TaxID=2883214 RepID=UPI0015B3EE9F|nr:hypothetical protein [Lacrimispora sp. 210928-DFI.3.58]